MRIAIMQPYLFPYIGYYSLIKNSDHFVFFDTPQYIRKGWINRNRILSCSNEPIFFTVPIKKCSRNTAINAVYINDSMSWKEKIYGQLSIYKNKAPYYDDTLELIKTVLESEEKSMSELAINSIKITSEYLGIDKKFDVFSEMGMNDIQVDAPDEWALYITKRMGYDTYINPPGGKEFFDSMKYEQEKINLFFLEQEVIPYKQIYGDFIPGLSIIDVLMFCNIDEINDMMNYFKMI